jgi:hypothetical protein
MIKVGYMDIVDIVFLQVFIIGVVRVEGLLLDPRAEAISFTVIILLRSCLVFIPRVRHEAKWFHYAWWWIAHL